MRERPVSRLESRAVLCPECFAAADEKCIGARGQVRESSHQARVNVVLKQRGGGR